MAVDGLVVGTSGNVSARVGDRIAITPTGVDYAELTPESIVLLDGDGAVVAGDLAPTSELPLHLALYRLAGRRVGAVVHTHAVHATAVSLLVDELPAVHYNLAVLGGPVRVARYAGYGTPELADAVVDALGTSHGCLMANHGAVTVGANLAAAYDRALQLEWLCRVWLTARAVGEPRPLPPGELDRMVERMRTYGAAGRER